MHDTKSDIKEFKDIRTNLLSELNQYLLKYQVFYFPVIKSFDDQACQVKFDSTAGSVIFIKKTIKINFHINYIVSQNQVFPQLKKDFSSL